MLDWWTRNFKYVALPVLIGSVLLSWLSPSLNYEFFCKGDNSCFREWVSALSGWAAVVAAAITLHFLRHQIKAANEYQRENVELTITAKLVIARAYLWQISVIEDSLEFTLEQCPSHDGWPLLTPDDERTQMMCRCFKAIYMDLVDARVQNFEDEIGTQMPAEVAKLHIEHTIGILSDGPAIVERLTDRGIKRTSNFEVQVMKATRSAQNYISTGRETAEAFIARWETRLSES